jgi:hypothetical protein
MDVLLWVLIWYILDVRGPWDRVLKTKVAWSG